MKKAGLVCALMVAICGFAQSQPLTVTSPNGGENWALGSTHNITWRSLGLKGLVNILLFDGTQRVGVIKDNVPVTAGSFSWVVGSYTGGTAAPGANYRIRIRQAQTEIMDVSDRPFMISGMLRPVPSASISVIGPNGGETWTLTAMHPNNATVTWKSQNVSGDVTVVLKKGGNPVRSQTVPNTGSCSFSYMGVAEGADYKIRVESADRSVSDESDGSFSIKKEAFAGVTPKPIQMAVAVVDFKLNNGAEMTGSPRVTMDHSARGNPTYYRWRNEARPDWGPWVPYADSHPEGLLPESYGDHTIYFQIKNNDGESVPVSDSIRYVQTELEMGPGALGVCPCPQSFSGWKWSAVETSFPQNLFGLGSTLTCADNHAGCYWTIVIEAKETQYMLVNYGAKYEFEFFAGRQLNEGWSFVRLEYDGQEGEGKGYRITRMPQPGSRDISFRVRIWVDAGRGSCIFKIKKIFVKGPLGSPVSEAFR